MIYDWQDLLSRIGKGIWTTLCAIAAIGFFLFLLSGPRPAYQDDPVFHAALKGEIDSVRRYIETNGTERVNHAGETLLHVASRWKHCDMVKELLSHSANVSVRDHHGKTPLHLLAYPSYGSNDVSTVEIASLLIKAGADVNAEDRFGQTPLRLARRFPQDDWSHAFAEVLLNAGGTDSPTSDTLIPRHFGHVQDGSRCSDVFLETSPDFAFAPLPKSVTVDRIVYNMTGRSGAARTAVHSVQPRQVKPIVTLATNAPLKTLWLDNGADQALQVILRSSTGTYQATLPGYSVAPFRLPASVVVVDVLSVSEAPSRTFNLDIRGEMDHYILNLHENVYEWKVMSYK